MTSAPNPSDSELAQILRRVIDDLRTPVAPMLMSITADTAVVRLRDRGCYANMRVGLPSDGDVRYSMEWFAGRLLFLIEVRRWDGLKELLKLAENFLPRELH